MAEVSAYGGTLTSSYTITDTAANLATDAATNGGAGTVIAGQDVTVSDAATLAQLAAIDGAAATVTYTEITDTVANLTANTDGYVTGAVNVTITDAATSGELATIDGMTTGTVTAASLADTAANLLASSYLGSGTDVTVTDAATIAQLTDIDAANGAGTLTYTDMTDTAANLAANTGGYLTGAINATLTDAATIAQLTTIDGLTTGTLTYTDMTDTAANLAANAGGYLSGAVNATISDSPTVGQVSTIDGLTTGTVAFNEISDTAANLATDAATNGGAGTVIAGQDVTVSDAATLAQLAAIDGAAATVTYTEITDTVANLTANTDGYLTGAVNVTVTDAATSGELATIDAMTTGTVTANSLADTAVNLLASPYLGSGTDVTVTDAATIAQLTDIDAANGAGTLTYTDMTDTAANLAANTGGYLTGAINATLTDAATIAQLTSIDGLTTGTLSYSLSDSAANLTGAAAILDNAVDITATDAATVAEATTIEAATNSGTTSYDVTDTAATIAASNDTVLGGGSGAVTASTAATAAEAGTIAAFTTAVSYNVSDTAANLAASTGLNEAVNLTATDTATAAEATTLYAATNSGATTYSLADAADAIAAADANAVSAATELVATAAAGDQTFTGTAGADVIRAGAGADTINGGAGNDLFVIVGVTGAGQYSSAAGDFVMNGVDLEALGVASEASVNNFMIDEATDGFGGFDSYDGGADGATLVIYGNTDLSNVSLANITDVVVKSDVVFSETQMAALIANAADITGDGGSTLRIADDGTGEIDLSALTLSDIGQLELGDNVAAVASQANVDAIATLSSGFTGAALKADSGTLNLDSKVVFGSAAVQDSAGGTQDILGALGIQNLAGIIFDINAMIGAEDGSEADTINQMLVSMGAAAEPLAVVNEYALMVDKMGDATHDTVLVGRDGVQNFIAGGMGSDVLTGGQGATNFIYGGMKGTSDGTASTQITGGEQRDFVAGSEDIDIIHGGSGNDFIDGGDGNDIIYGEAGTNFIHAGTGADRVYVDTADFIAIDNNGGPADADTIVLNARAVGTSYVIGFGAEDVLAFTEADFISGNGGLKNVLGVGANGSAFDLNTIDFSGIAAISDNAAADFSDVGAIIGAAVTNTEANDAFVFAVDNGTDTAIISWQDDGNGSFDLADDVSVDVILVGFADAATLTLSNFDLLA